MEPRTAGAFGEFPRTTGIWGFVEQVKAGTDTREALQALLSQYRAPLKAHLVVRKKMSSEKADDLLQSFIESKILRLKLIERAERSKGRFRSFLLTALDRFWIDEMRKVKEPVQALGEMQVDEAQDREDDAFNVAWGRQVIEAAFEKMRQHCREQKRPDVWGVFEQRMVKPILQGAEPASYEVLQKQFGFTSAAQASNVLVTAKRAFKRALEEVISEYEDGAAHVQEELAALQHILGGEGAG